MPSTVSPIASHWALSQSMTTVVQRSIRRWVPSGFSTRSIMSSVVPRTNPAVQSGPREVTIGRMWPRSRIRCRCILIRCRVSAAKASASTFGSVQLVDVLEPVQVWYSLGVLSCQNLILAPSTDGSAAIPYSIHHEGTKMMSGNSSMILRFDWNQSSGSR